MISTFMQNIITGKIKKVARNFVLVSILHFSSALISVNAQTIYAVTSANNLISFNASTPGTILNTTPLTGMLAGHTFEGLDFRPANGQLYAFSYRSSDGQAQLYRVKISTGVLTPVGAPVTLATGMSSIGFDFNPTVDRIRITSATRQNYRLVPDNGALAFTDGTLTYAAGDANAAATPNIRAVAYTNSFSGSTTTTIYYYDFNLNIISTSAAPNGGSMTTVGSSGITASASAGIDLDILTNTSTSVNTAYLAAATATNSNFYSVNLSTGAATLVGMIGSGVNVIEIAAGVMQMPTAKLVYGLSNNNLISFYSNAPATILSTVALSNIGAGQTVVGLDFRPATGQLFAMGYVASTGAAQLYTINLATGAATTVGNPSTLAVNMTGIGFDFNPTVDRIRVTSSQRQNYRLNPNDGTLAVTDTQLSYAGGDANAAATPNVQAVAYTNSFAGSTATTIYYYDVSLNVLTTSAAPNGGVMTTVGSSGVVANTSAEVDLDISTNQGSASNTAFLLASLNGTVSNLYMVNLATGAASLSGTIGSGNLVSDIAVYLAPPPPVKNVFAIQGSNLINFSTINPGSIISSIPITGITAGQSIEGLDFRPATGQLFAMGYRMSTGETQLYVINTSTGVATSVGAAITLASNMTGIGFDFNPTVDRIRVTSSNRKNYRLNPNDGTLAVTDTDLTYSATDVNSAATPNIHAVAYTNSFAGATTTTIYYYDYSLDNLATSAAPNGGVLTTVGASGITTGSAMGLDLDILTNQSTSVATGFLSASATGANSNFYTINLFTGEVNSLGTIGGSGPISEMAVSNIDLSLPITLTEFAVQKISRTSKLTWTTQSEVNNQYFVIERSSNGSTFAPLSSQIASKAVAGNSTLRLSYEYIDVIPAKGKNFYRLTQVDRDGLSKLSNVLQVQFDDVSGIKVYPNPTRGIVNVSAFVYSSTSLGVRVIDAAGKDVKQFQYKVNEGAFNSRIDLSSLQSGVYYVILSDNENVLYKQMVQKQ